MPSDDNHRDGHIAPAELHTLYLLVVRGRNSPSFAASRETAVDPGRLSVMHQGRKAASHAPGREEACP